MNTWKLSRTQSFSLLDGAMNSSLLNIKLHALFVGVVLIRMFPAALHTVGAPGGGKNFTVLVSLKVIKQE